jgi:hypothetical protein
MQPRRDPTLPSRLRCTTSRSAPRYAARMRHDAPPSRLRCTRSRSAPRYVVQTPGQPPRLVSAAPRRAQRHAMQSRRDPTLPFRLRCTTSRPAPRYAARMRQVAMACSRHLWGSDVSISYVNRSTWMPRAARALSRLRSVSKFSHLMCQFRPSASITTFADGTYTSTRLGTPSSENSYSRVHAGRRGS